MTISLERNSISWERKSNAKERIGITREWNNINQAIEDSLKIWANYSRSNEDCKICIRKHGSVFVRLIFVFVMHDSTSRILLYPA